MRFVETARKAAFGPDRSCWLKSNRGQSALIILAPGFTLIDEVSADGPITVGAARASRLVEMKQPTPMTGAAGYRRILAGSAQRE